MGSKQERIRGRLGIFSLVWIILTSGGIWFGTLAATPYVLLFDVLLIFVQFTLVCRMLLTRSYDRSPVILFIVLGVCVLMSIISNSDYASFLSYARLMLIILLAFGTSLLLANDVIATVFVKVVVVLAGISVFCFFTKIIDNNASIFPTIVSYDYTYVNAFIYVILDSVERRNTGIYREPGLFQIYLCIALFVLLHTRNKYRYQFIATVILLAAIYSTKSTTGYILGILIVSGNIFSVKPNKKNIIFFLSKVALVVFAVIFALKSDIFFSNIEEKFSGEKRMSFVYRVNASIIDYRIILENPIVGIGMGGYMDQLDHYSNSDLTVDASVNTFSQLGATIGIPFVLIILWRIVLFVMRFKIKFVGKCIFLAIYIIAFSTEPFMLFPLFYLPVFMSYRDWGSSCKRTKVFQLVKQNNFSLQNV